MTDLPHLIDQSRDARAWVADLDTFPAFDPAGDTSAADWWAGRVAHALETQRRQRVALRVDGALVAALRSGIGPTCNRAHSPERDQSGYPTLIGVMPDKETDR